MGFIEKDDPRDIPIPEAFKNMSLQRRRQAQADIALLNGLRPGEVCIVCLEIITTQIFRGDGWCGDDHRKIHLTELKR